MSNARFPTLTDQLFRLASGEVTAVELAQRSLQAIEASQSTLNAFRTVLAESALAQAAAADARRAAGARAPLLGVPIAVMDDTDIAGVPTYFGTDGPVAPAGADAEVVRRLRAAGAVIVGKTNTPELGQWPFTGGAGFGHTRNPWSQAHTPGGSSGGSAAAVAAGLVTAAIGSDTAGGVRIPAAWTNLVGIKPQRGSAGPLPESFHGLGGHGVLARTVADAALVLDAAGGNADADGDQPPPVAEYVGEAVGELRIAVSTGLPFTGFRAGLHPQITAALERVAGRLEQLGHRVMFGNPDYGRRLSWNFLSRFTSGLLDWERRLGGPAGGAASFDPRTVAHLRTGRVLSQAVLRSALAHQAVDQHRVGSIFRIVHVVVAPTTAQPPPLVDAFAGLGPLATDRAMIAACPLTWPWNVLGWPSINVPAGFTADGLPIGVQLMGAAGSEPLLVSLAAELEAVSGWAARQPDVWW